MIHHDLSHIRRNVIATLLVVSLWLLAGTPGLAQGDAAEDRVATLEQEIVDLRDRVDALSAALESSNLLLAGRYLAAAEFHAMDAALHDGTIDPGYLGTVQTTLAAVSSLRWPDGVQDAKEAFVSAARELEAALQAQDATAAAAAAEDAHAREHDLTHAIFEHLTGGVPTGAADGHAEHDSADGAESEGAEEAGEGAEDGESFLLAIAENGAPIGGVLTHRVQRGDAIVWTIRTQRAGELHLHGYDLDWELQAGEEMNVSFEGESAGRFPVEFHPEGTDRGVVVAYLEVHP